VAVLTVTRVREANKQTTTDIASELNARIGGTSRDKCTKNFLKKTKIQFNNIRVSVVIRHT